MDAFLVSAIIITIIILILAFSLIKNVVKAILVALFILSLVMGVYSYYVYKDAMDLKENFMSEEKLMVLTDGDNHLTAISITDFTKVDSFKHIPIENIDLENNDYYKTMIFDISAFNQSLEDGITIGNDAATLERSEVEDMIYSDSPLDIFLKKATDRQNIPDELKEESKQIMMKELGVESEDEFKSMVFLMMIFDMLSDEGPAVLFNKMKTGEIEVIPKTPVFKAISFVPSSLIPDMVGVPP